MSINKLFCYLSNVNRFIGVGIIFFSEVENNSSSIFSLIDAEQIPHDRSTSVTRILFIVMSI